MAGRVGVQVPVGDPQASREGKLRRPQASVPCTSAVTLLELKAGPLPDTPVKTPRDHAGAMKGGEGKLRSGFGLGGRGRSPGRGSACWSLPLWQRQAGKNRGDSVATGAGPGEGGCRGDGLYPRSKRTLRFSLTSQACPALCTAQYWLLLRFQVNLAFSQHHR